MPNGEINHSSNSLWYILEKNDIRLLLLWIWIDIKIANEHTKILKGSTNESVKEKKKSKEKII